MRIREDMLAALVSLNAAQAVMGKDAIRPAKKTWWAAVRGEYGLDPSTKYKVVTSGENAGELRFKHDGVIVPATEQGKFIVVFPESHTRYATVEAAKMVVDSGEAVAQIVD